MQSINMWNPINDTPICRQERKDLVNKIHELSDEIERLKILLKKAQDARDAYRLKSSNMISRNLSRVQPEHFKEVMEKAIEVLGISKSDVFQNRQCLVLISLLLIKKGYNKAAIGRSIGKDRSTIFGYLTDHQEILPKDLNGVDL